MRKGMTLIELVLALLVLGILSTAAVPIVGGLRDRYLVQAVASDIAGAHNRARIRAILEGKVTELDVRADSLIVSVMGPTGNTVVWSAPGPLASNVAFPSAPRKLAFAPTGITTGFANATFVVSRGGAQRQIVVSRMGRVRVIP